MSEVNAGDLRPIQSADDILETYAGTGNNAKTGVEIELTYFDPQSPNLRPMTIPQNKVVKNAANAKYGNDFARNEPTPETLEISSFAKGPDNLKAIMSDTQDKIEKLTTQAADIGLKRSYFQHLPEQTAANLLGNVMDIERYQAFFDPPREDMMGVAAYFSVCKSNQVSISYRTPNHLLENIRRLYLLAPFLFMIMDNNAPFDEGKIFNGHTGMRHRTALKNHGGIPPQIFTATSGEDYINAHIDQVMNNPLFVYYDQKGKLIRLPSGTWTSFNKLKEQNLNTTTNYFFSESILWPDIKIAALKNENGEVINHRYEARMFGVGLHQHQTALLITAALAFDNDFAESIDDLLFRYGFNISDLNDLKHVVDTSYYKAQKHNGKFLNIGYGTGQMIDFSNEFSDLISRSSLMQNYQEELAPLLTICRTGCTDSKVNALLFNTLEKAQDFQRSYDPEIFLNPNQCARTLFEKEIIKHPKTTSDCSAV